MLFFLLFQGNYKETTCPVAKMVAVFWLIFSYFTIPAVNNRFKSHGKETIEGTFFFFFKLCCSHNFLTLIGCFCVN